MFTDKRLEEVLKERKLLRSDQTEVVREERRRTGESFADICLRLDFVDKATIQSLLSEVTGIPFIDDSFGPDSDGMELFSFETMSERKFVVWKLKRETIEVAMVDPYDLVTRDHIVDRLQNELKGRTISFFYIFPKQLEKVLSTFLKKEESNFSAQAPGHDDVVNLVDSLLQNALKAEASDIHFQPSSHLVHVRFRVDGVLQTAYELHENIWPHVVIRLKVLSNLDISESRRPQSGHFSLTIQQQRVDFRVSTHPTIHGESLVIRVLTRNKQLVSLDQLGFEAPTVLALKRLIQRPYGLILLCGPTGSGKTTTLYALCAQMDASTKNIMTLEDPVEYQFENIRQTEIQHSDVLGFADGVRSILRQDPDIIFIGEIRDEETAQMALRASMTGHLVLSTVHANDVLQAPLRLMDLGIPMSLLSGQLLALLSQRLVRRFCRSCGGRGCKECQRTGYKGRLAISELLVMNEVMDACLAQIPTWNEWRCCARENGYIPLYQDGLQKVQKGVTSIDEVNSVCGKL